MILVLLDQGELVLLLLGDCCRRAQINWPRTARVGRVYQLDPGLGLDLVGGASRPGGGACSTLQPERGERGTAKGVLEILNRVLEAIQGKTKGRDEKRGQGAE